MADTRTFLVRTLEQIKRFAHNPAATRSVTEIQLLEDIRRAHVGVYEDLAAAMGPEAQFFYSLHTVTLTEDQEWLSVPATFRKFHHLVKRDDTGKIVLARRKHTPGTLQDRIGVAITPDLRRLRFCPVVTGQEAGDWELAFESGPIELHYGNPVSFANVTGASLTPGTTVIDSVPPYYTFNSGDIIKITAGTNVTVGRYDIVSYDSATNSFVLDRVAGTETNQGDIVYDIYKADRIFFDQAPAKGQLLNRADYYTGARIFIVSGDGIEQVNSVTDFNEQGIVTTLLSEAVLLENWATVPDKDSVYEIRPWLPGRPDEFDEIIAWRAALKYRRIRGDDPPGEGAALREIKHIRSEMLRRMDVNTDKAPSIPRPRPARSRAIWNR
jgi:hypothetical protein